MKTLITKLTLSVILFLPFSLSFSQNHQRTISEGNLAQNNFSGTITPESEYLLFYERLISDNHSIEIGYGRKFISGNNNYREDNAALYKGDYYNIAYRYYFTHFKFSSIYISPLLFFKNYHFDHAYFIDPRKWDDGYDTQLRSSKKRVAGLKFLFGYKVLIPLSKKPNSLQLFLDAQSGLGYRIKDFNDLIHAKGISSDANSCNCPFLEEPIKTTAHDNGLLDVSKNGGFVSLHLTLRAGLAF